MKTNELNDAIRSNTLIYDMNDSAVLKGNVPSIYARVNWPRPLAHEFGPFATNEECVAYLEQKLASGFFGAVE